MERADDNWKALLRDHLRYLADAGFREAILPPRETVSRNMPTLEDIRKEMGECTRCPLHQGRRNIVFGEGDPNARVMFVGEGPGAEEDAQGRPFVGRAGQLLTKMINAMTLDRSDVYITNIVKSRPPDNRDPRPEEIEACLPFLEAQIEAIQPEVIVALGRVASNALLDTNAPLSRIRGEFQERDGIPVMPTYHPSFLLRTGEDRRWKGQAWSDLKKVMALLGIPPTAAGNKS